MNGVHVSRKVKCPSGLGMFPTPQRTRSFANILIFTPNQLSLTKRALGNISARHGRNGQTLKPLQRDRRDKPLWCPHCKTIQPCRRSLCGLCQVYNMVMKIRFHQTEHICDDLQFPGCKPGLFCMIFHPNTCVPKLQTIWNIYQSITFLT